MSGSGTAFRFGIPSLDLLLGKRVGPLARETGQRSIDDFGIWLEHSDVPTSLCLMGPDGSGKSVLALHLASRYSADTAGITKVLYVSTDLNYRKAHEVWKNFALDRPSERKSPFGADYASSTDESAPQAVWRYSNPPCPSRIELRWYSPELVASSNPETPAEPVLARQENMPRTADGTVHIPSGGESEASQPGVADPQSRPIDEVFDPTVEPDNPSGHTPIRGSAEVAFVDLAWASAGDDWGFLCRTVATLDTPTDYKPRHLLIIDAVEGFEVFDGDNDAFGQKRSRRARISEIMRLAARKCHVVLVIEESKPGERSPEEFVTDAVIRLRHRTVRDYARRTVEVEKARGQSHIRGEHTYTIRKGSGSTTLLQENFDDPKNFLDGGNEKKEKILQAYVLIFPSVHCQSREFMESMYEGRKSIDALAGFGIKYLDNLLIRGDTNKSGNATGPSAETRPMGLPYGSVTSVIGDPHTYKRRLGWSFLAEEFQDLVQSVEAAYSRSCKLPSFTAEAMEKELESHGQLAQCGGVVLITSVDTSDSQLAGQFTRWYTHEMQTRIDPAHKKPLEEVLRKLIQPRITCRRLEVHDIPNSVLLHIIDQAIAGTRRSVTERGGTESKIRLVLDDLSTFKEIYPDISQEPLFVPALLFRLRRSKVATLIVDTHPGGPESSILDPFDNEVRALVDYHLYTWRVSFFGENRIAIAMIPPVSGSGSDLRSVVRELKWSDDDERPEVDPHFEMYSGLEEGRPKPVPLEVRLHSETPAFSEYIRKENLVWRDLFTPARGTDVLVGTPPEDYQTLHDFSVMRQDTRQDHTLILQVDDFWSCRRGDSLEDRSRYLKATTWSRGKSDMIVDPLGAFNPGHDAEESQLLEPFTRLSGFPEHATLFENPKKQDRVPFSWDFGFLLCQRPAWEASQSLPLVWSRTDPDPRDTTVGSIWGRMKKAYGQSPELSVDTQREATVKRPSWRAFLGACEVVARHQNDAIPFDLSLIAAESFSCLVFEVWASEVIGSRQPGAENLFCGGSLCDLLGDPSYRKALYKTWLLLVDTLQLDTISDSDDVFEPQTHVADPRAVATRHWYKSACARDGSKDDVVPVGLPGNYSVRGDWYLVVAGNSRSVRLADRACDFLSTRRANFVRLQMGLGLPTRDVLGSDKGDIDRIRTGLRASTKTGALGNVPYGDLTRIGAIQEKDFRWLWRSGIKHYDSHARIWQKWLYRVAIAWNERRLDQKKPVWVGGFEIYDRMGTSTAALDAAWIAAWQKASPVSCNQYRETWDAFERLCNAFVMLARHATPREN